MMVRLRLIVLLVLALALAGPAAHAVIYYNWNSGQGGDFSTPGDPNHIWPVCVYKVHNPWFNNPAFDREGPADDPNEAYSQGGTVPSEDPIVNQLFRNRTQNLWTDWHCDITGGSIVPGSVQVYNDGVQTPPWTITYTATGFKAETVSGSGTYVGYLGLLHGYFEYVGTGTVTFSQYPTTTAPIPEPASMIGLISGLAALGFGIRRKK